MKKSYEDPSYWDDQRASYQAVYDEQLKDYRKFAAWLVGETTDANGTRLKGKLGRRGGRSRTSLRWRSVWRGATCSSGARGSW